MVEQNGSLSLSASTVPFGSEVKVSWKVPDDEATNKDWIGGNVWLNFTLFKSEHKCALISCRTTWLGNDGAVQYKAQHNTIMI